MKKVTMKEKELQTVDITAKSWEKFSSPEGHEDILKDTPKHIEGHECINTFSGNDLEHAVDMGYEVYYSQDGKRLLDATAPLTTYTMEEGTEVVCNGAFCGTGAIEIIPAETLKAIGFNAFGSKQLKRFVIPRNVRHIDLVNPVATALHIEEAICQSPYFVIENGLLYTRDHKILYGAVTNDYPRDLILPDGLMRIANGAFEGRPLNSLYLPDSVDAIGIGAFVNTGLKQLRLSQSLTIIPPDSFAGNQLVSIEIPETVQSIGDNALGDSVTLTKVTYYEGTEIGQDAFGPCSNIVVKNLSR